jgi:recombination protein RecA
MAKAAEKEKDTLEEDAPKTAKKTDLLAGAFKNEAIAALRKKFGSSILMRAVEMDARVVHRIPTGIFQLDYALSGGFQVGMAHEVHGPKSAGKTTILLKALAQAQKRCATCWELFEASGKCPTKGCDTRQTVCAFVDVEGTCDLKWAQLLGVDLNRLMYARTTSAEEALDVCVTLLRSGVADVIVLDSIAFLSPTKEIEESVSAETMGLQARVLGKGVRKFVAALNEAGNSESGRRPTLLFTNQIRMKIGVMFGNPETTSGGMAPGFMFLSETKFWPGKFEISDSGWPTEVLIKFRVEKHKGGLGPKKEDEFQLILRDDGNKRKGDVRDEMYMIKLGIQYNVFQKHGHMISFMEHEFGNEAAMETEMMKDPVLNLHVREALMKILVPA